MPTRTDRLEILLRIVAEVLVEADVDRERGAGRQQDGVAVGRGARDGVGRDAAAGAGAVLDHHRLLEDFLHLLGEDARHHVARAAGRKAEDQRDRLGRELGRAGRRHRCRAAPPMPAASTIARFMASSRQTFCSALDRRLTID